VAVRDGWFIALHKTQATYSCHVDGGVVDSLKSYRDIIGIPSKTAGRK